MNENNLLCNIIPQNMLDEEIQNLQQEIGPENIVGKMAGNIQNYQWLRLFELKYID